MVPSLRQIAAKAGVSHMTVSLALRNHPSLPLETRQKLQALAEEMGYRPKALLSAAMAQLRQGAHGSYKANLALLLFLPDVLAAQQPFQQWIKGIKDRSEQLGYGLEIINLVDSEMDLRRLRQSLYHQNTKGLILINALGMPWLPELGSVLNDYPVSIAGWSCSDAPAYHRALNDAFGTGFMLVRRCYQAGYRSIGVAMEDGLEELTHHQFNLGLESALRLYPEIQQFPTFYIGGDEARNFATWFLKHHPECIITTNAQVQNWLKPLSLKKEVALVHWNLYPEIGEWSGVEQHNAEIGAAAVDLVIGQIHRGEIGVPPHGKRVMIAGTWHEGKTAPEKKPEQHPSWANRYHPDKTHQTIAWQKLDLRAYANANPTHAGQWLGSFSLQHWLPGEEIIHGVPFQLIDPTRNKDRSVIIPALSEKTGEAESITIPVNFKAEELFFLHACGLVSEPGPFADYTVTFTDGRQEKIPLIAYLNEYALRFMPERELEREKKKWKQRANLKDWWPHGPPLDFPEAHHLEVTSQGDASEYVRYLYTLRWKNLHPRQGITSITINQQLISATRLAVFAITALTQFKKGEGQDILLRQPSHVVLA